MTTRPEGLLHEPARTTGGHRDYRPGVIQRVAFIQQAQAADLVLGQIGQVLAIHDGGQPPCQHVGALVDQQLT